jgi:hypothetical protein
MLPGGTDGAYRDALAGPHQPYTRIEVWKAGVRQDAFGDAGVPVYSGSINATLNSQVTRQLTLTTDEALWPVFETDLMNPYTNELRVFQGVRAGSSPPYEWQTFRGRVSQVQLDQGHLSVSAKDRAGDVEEADFLFPTASNVGLSLLSQFKQLVSDGVPDATFGASTFLNFPTPNVVWESGRSSACDDLANAGNAFWYALANGDYVMRTVPWTIAQVALLTLRDGPTGSLYTATPQRSRENVFNAVSVAGERADATTPVVGFVTETDPTSVLYPTSGFGVKAKQISISTISTQDQALSTAQSYLNQFESLTVSWSLTMPGDPSMELGDPFIISARNLPQDLQVVQNFTLSLVGEPMSVSTRAVVPGFIQEG